MFSLFDICPHSDTINRHPFECLPSIPVYNNAFLYKTVRIHPQQGYSSPPRGVNVYRFSLNWSYTRNALLMSVRTHALFFRSSRRNKSLPKIPITTIRSSSPTRQKWLVARFFRHAVVCLLWLSALLGTDPAHGAQRVSDRTNPLYSVRVGAY